MLSIMIWHLFWGLSQVEKQSKINSPLTFSWIKEMIHKQVRRFSFAKIDEWQHTYLSLPKVCQIEWDRRTNNVAFLFIHSLFFLFNKVNWKQSDYWLNQYWISFFWVTNGMFGYSLEQKFGSIHLVGCHLIIPSFINMPLLVLKESTPPSFFQLSKRVWGMQKKRNKKKFFEVPIINHWIMQ